MVYIRYMISTPFTQLDIDFLMTNYPKHGIDYCCKTLGRSRASVFSKTHRLRLKYYRSHIDLDKLRDERGAYLLGFLWADGNIRKDTYVVRCQIAEDDGEQIKRLFERTGRWKITYRAASYQDGINRKRQMGFEVHDKHLHSLLKDLGYGDKGTRSPSKVLSALPPIFHHYFWRGYLDGDGCFYTGTGISVNFSGPIDQCWESLTKQLKSLQIQYRYDRYERSSGHSSRITLSDQESILRFGVYIYKGEQFGLDRKMKKFEQILDRCAKRQKRGYSFDKRRSCYYAEATLGDNKHYLGRFALEEEAKEARLRFIKQHQTREWRILELVKEGRTIVSPGASSQAAKSEPAMTSMA